MRENRQRTHSSPFKGELRRGMGPRLLEPMKSL